jgi:hypothetical protein
MTEKVTSFVQLRMTDSEFGLLKARAAALSDDFRVVTPTDVARVAFRAGLVVALGGSGQNQEATPKKKQKHGRQ